MRLVEIFNAPLAEMAFSRDVAKMKAVGREETINHHLVKLIAFKAPESTRDVWRREIISHLRYLARIRVKPNARLIKKEDWREWLYAGPFEHTEIGTTDALISEVNDFERNDLDTAEVHSILARVHDEISDMLATGRSEVSLP